MSMVYVLKPCTSFTVFLCNIDTSGIWRSRKLKNINLFWTGNRFLLFTNNIFSLHPVYIFHLHATKICASCWILYTVYRIPDTLPIFPYSTGMAVCTYILYSYEKKSWKVSNQAKIHIYCPRTCNLCLEIH